MIDEFIQHMAVGLSKDPVYFEGLMKIPYSKAKMMLLDITYIRSALQKADSTDARMAIYLHLLMAGPEFQQMLPEALGSLSSR